MGRDEHTTGGKNSSSLPQTPKKQKLSASQMREEMAREIAQLSSSRDKKANKK